MLFVEKLFVENFTAHKKCPDCHQVRAIGGVCGCDSAFRSQSAHNTARSKCSNRRLRAVTPELGIRINAVPEWWPEVSDPLLTDLTPMHSSPQPTAFNLRRMCCRSLRGLGGAFHEGLTWRGAPNGHPSFFERRIFIRSG